MVSGGHVIESLTEAVKIGNGRISPVAIVHPANPNVVNHLYQLSTVVNDVVKWRSLKIKTILYGMPRAELETLVVKVTKEANRFFYQTRYISKINFDAVVNGVRFRGHKGPDGYASSVYPILKDAK